MRTFEVWPPLVWVYAQYLVLFIHKQLTLGNRLH